MSVLDINRYLGLLSMLNHFVISPRYLEPRHNSSVSPYLRRSQAASFHTLSTAIIVSLSFPTLFCQFQPSVHGIALLHGRIEKQPQCPLFQRCSSVW